MLSDAEMGEMAKEELKELEPQKAIIEEDIKTLLLPKDPNDDRNIIVELRAGAGGDEAAIFVGDLFDAYTRYADLRGWKIELISTSPSDAGGYKEVTALIKGEQVYSRLKYEGGTHRVQRVPATESQGRVHTSAATVMVSPEAEEFDVEINMNEVRKDFFCSSGPGGQSVNTTYSAVRLTHEPTGIVCQCQDQKSQHKNLEKALKVLRSRLYERELAIRNEADSERRASMVTSGDRSAKIRTYNYPQGRVTDHRINLTLYSLGDIMNGDIQKISDELRLADNTAKLKAGEEL